MESTTEVTTAEKTVGESYFDGGVFQLLGWKILGGIVTAITLGICYPVAICWLYKWETKHTVINGRQLKFTGTAGGLFGTWIICLLLTIVTLGIYGFYVPIKIKKWREANTFFYDEIPTLDDEVKLKAEKASYFDGGFWQLFGWYLLGGLVTGLTLGICYPWAIQMIYSWEQRHKVYCKKRCTFDGTATSLFGTWLLCLLLTIVTLGIYSFWIPIRIKKWQIKHTHLLEDETPAEEQEEKALSPEEIEAKKALKEKDRKTFTWVLLAGVCVMILGLFIHFGYPKVKLYFYSLKRIKSDLTRVAFFYNFFEYYLKFIGIALIMASSILKLSKKKYINKLDLIGIISIGLSLFVCFILYPAAHYGPIFFAHWGWWRYWGKIFKMSGHYLCNYRYWLTSILRDFVLLLGYIATIIGFVKTKE